MALRGRSSAGKRSVLPNLSLAGKREEKTKPLSPKKKKNDWKDNRGARNRRQKSCGSVERSSLIESSGIFSEGLSCVDSVRRTKLVRNESDELCVSTHTIVKEEPVNVSVPENAQSSHTGYEESASYGEIWASDNEGDIEELNELLNDEFISDFKHATVLPRVLPVELESQFIDLMHKKVKQNILDQERDVKMECDLDIKEHILGGFDEEQEVDDGESPSSKRSRKAARILRDMRKEGREDDFFMIQLPSVLKLLCQEKQSEEKVIFHSSHSNGSSKQTGIQAMEGDALSNAHGRTTMEQLTLPSGQSIGKLVVTKSGRVLLRVGGHSMDVAHTTSEGQHQTVVMVETNPRAQEGFAMENGGPRFGSWHGGGDGKNAIYYIGNIRHHFTASLDWESLKPIGFENSSSTMSDVSLLSRKIPDPEEVGRIKEELDDLQQQISIDIAAALNRWNT